MWQDSIVAQVRRAREEHAARFGFDLRAIYRALKEQEEQSEREKVSFAPKRISLVETEILTRERVHAVGDCDGF